MAVHLHAFRQHLIDHRIRCGKSKLALHILQRIRLHRIACRGHVMMHLQQLQPYPFQILGRNGVPDQKIIPVRILHRNQILLDSNRTSTRMLKADIVNVKGRCSVIRALHINRQIFIAHAVIAVAAFKFHPAVSSIDSLGGECDIIGAAAVADLCGQLKLRTGRIDQLDPGGDQIFAAFVHIFLHMQRRPVPG
ncbi:hypothetical protein D3C80_1366690 [compost metagenome]